MKIVREHINEIKQNIKGSGLNTIGVGHIAVMQKLREFIKNNSFFSSLIHHDANGKRIANLLNLSLENVRMYGIDLDITETILYFDQCKKLFIKYNKTYWIWENPDFIIEYNNKLEETRLYTNTNLNE